MDERIEEKIMFDERDFAIIEELKKNSRLSEKKLSKRTGIPMTTIHNRIAKLRKNGVLENFTVRLNYPKIGKPIAAFVFVKAVNQADQKELFSNVCKIPAVYEAALITGEFDILFKARVASMEELKEIVVGSLRKQKGVGETQTIVCYDLFERV